MPRTLLVATSVAMLLGCTGKPVAGQARVEASPSATVETPAEPDDGLISDEARQALQAGESIAHNLETMSKLSGNPRDRAQFEQGARDAREVGRGLAAMSEAQARSDAMQPMFELLGRLLTMLDDHHSVRKYDEQKFLDHQAQIDARFKRLDRELAGDPDDPRELEREALDDIMNLIER